MSRLEKRFVGWVQENIGLFAFTIAIGVSFMVRLPLFENQSGDVGQFFLPWSEQMRQQGFASLAEGVGIYSVPLQLLLMAQTFLPIDTVLAIKLTAVLFDYILAFGVAWIVVILKNDAAPQARRRWFMIAYAATVLMPVPVLNSAYWGQSEGVYACFAIFSVACLLRHKYVPAFLLYGLALSIKLQAILLFPLFVILYFVQKRFSLWHFLLIPLVWFCTTLPAIFAGASPLVGLEIYLGQTGYDRVFYLNYPGFTAFAQFGYYEILNPVAIAAALFVCFGMLALLLYHRLKVEGSDVLLLAIWSVLACVLFLPGMHERYAYLAEILLWAYVMVRPAKRTVAWAVVFTFTGYAAYASFLFGQWTLPAEILAMLNVAAFANLTWTLLRGLPKALPKRVAAQQAAEVPVLEEERPSV